MLIIEYCGLMVVNLVELCRFLMGLVIYVVVKNIFIKWVVFEVGIEGFDELFVGFIVIVFVIGELVDVVKVIKIFVKEYKVLVIKGGYMDGYLLIVVEVECIVDLEFCEVLLVKLVGVMKGNLVKVVGLFNVLVL